jgi:hypothetical protein
MLDMGFLTYQPDCRRMRGTDHAIVGLAIHGDALVVHDPAGYVNARLPLGDLLKSWRAENIYTHRPYVLWKIGSKGPALPQFELFRQVLSLGLENLRRQSERYPRVDVLYGSEALRVLAADVRSGLATRWLKKYAYFTLRVSGQRCFDSGRFIRDCPFQNEHLDRAARVRLMEAEYYGEAQWAAASGQPGLLAETLEKLADAEAAFTTSLADGMACRSA